MPEITFIAPTPALAPFVSVYWHLNAQQTGQRIQSYIPGISVAWIFNLRAPGRTLVGNNADPLPSCFVKGPTTVASHVEPDASTENYGIAFKPGAAASFLRVPIANFRDQMLDLFALNDPKLSSLAHSVQHSDFQSAACQFDRFLWGRLNESSDTYLGGLLYQSLAGAARWSPARLINTSGYSERHLRRLFKEKLGVSPKTVARVDRLRKAVDAMSRGGQSLSVIAGATGYFDQAHLNRDFKAMIGTSPNVFQSSLAPIAKRFNAFEAGQPAEQSSR